MAIAYVGGQTAGRTNPSSALSVNFALTGGLASTPAAGDLVIVTCVTGSAAGNPAMAVTTPVGYTALGQLNQSSVTADTSMDVSWKFMGASPDTAVTIPGTGNNAFGEAYAIQVFRGVNASPMDATPVSGGGTGTGRPDPASITPLSAGAWPVICGGGAAGTGANYVAPANYTTNFVTSSGADTTDAMVGCGYRSDWASGAENPAAYTGGTTGANDSWCSYTLALRPALDVSGASIASTVALTAASVAMAVTTAALASSLALFEPSVIQTVTSGTITSGVVLSAPEVAQGGADQGVTGEYVTSTAALTAPSTAYAIDGASLASGVALYESTVAPGAVTIDGATIAAGSSPSAPTASYEVLANSLASTVALNAPTVAYSVALPAISSGSSLTAPTAAFSVEAAAIASGSALTGPSATYNATTAAIASGNSLFNPLVQVEGGDSFIDGTVIAAGSSVNAPSVATIYELTGGTIASGSSLTSPSAVYEIAGASQSSTVQLFDSTVVADQAVTGAHISSGAGIGSHVVSQGAEVTTAFIASGATLTGPSDVVFTVNVSVGGQSYSVEITRSRYYVRVL